MTETLDKVETYWPIKKGNADHTEFSIIYKIWFKHTVSHSIDEMINSFVLTGNISFSRKVKLNLFNHDNMFIYRRFKRHYTINKLVISMNLYTYSVLFMRC